MTAFPTLKSTKVYVFRNLEFWANSTLGFPHLINSQLTEEDILNLFIQSLIYKMEIIKKQKPNLSILIVDNQVLTTPEKFVNYLLQDADFKKFLLDYIKFIRGTNEH